MTPAVVGLDLAKNVAHVHVADPSGRMLESRKLARRDVLSFFRPLPSSLIGIKACATVHYWARELRALGHEVRLSPPGYVNPSCAAARRTMPPMRQPSVKPSRAQACALFRSSCRRIRPS